MREETAITPSTCLAIPRITCASVFGSSSVSTSSSAWSRARARAWAPLMSAGKNGLATSGTTSPTLAVRPVISPRAARLGV